MAYLPDPGCYRVFCVETGKQYIGSSAVAVKGRLADHRKKLRQHAGRCNAEMLADFIKFGERAFRFEVICRCAKNEVLLKEQELLASAENLYNSSRTASPIGPKDLKQAVRERMSRSAKARCTPEFRHAKSILMKKLRAEGRLLKRRV